MAPEAAQNSVPYDVGRSVELMSAKAVSQSAGEWGRGGLAPQRPRAFQILVTSARFGARGCTKQRPIRGVLCRAYVHEGCERWSGGALGWRPRGQGAIPFFCRHAGNTDCKEECKKCTVFLERRWQTPQFFLKDVAKDVRKTLVFLERRSIFNKRIDNLFF